MSTRGWSSSPFSYRRPSSPFLSSSSTSSFMNTSGRFVPRSCSTSSSSFCGSTNGYGARSTTPNRNQSGYNGQSPVGFLASEELSGEPLDVPRSSGDSISVIVRFRPMNDREYRRGDEITWYPDGDKIIRSKYNPGDQSSLGIIPLAIKDVFSIIQDTPRREFLLRVSYLEIYNEGTYVEGIKEEEVLSPDHALLSLLLVKWLVTSQMIESSAHSDEYDRVIFSQLNLIDLAGSESSKAETTGLRRKEGPYINKSLLTLGTVIGKLSEGKSSHIPYRDSKLTRLLQCSLSGRGHVLIVDEKSLIKKYQHEISSLKQELDQLRRGMLVGISHEEVMSLRQQVGVHYGLFANFRSVGCGGTYLGSDI
ncbi:hypothetical protein Ancab_011681 [Ancistrocladus abbreviatus]